MTLQLVPLDCPSCGSALQGEELDTIFFCEHCGAAATLGEEGLEMVDSAALTPAGGRSARTWRPAWLVEANVTVSERRRHRSRRGEGWREHRTFVIPAFEMPLGDLTRIARALCKAASDTAEVPRETIRGGTLSLGDAVTLIRHIVIGDEVRKSDMLASVLVEIDVTSSRLVAIPFEPTQAGLTCSITGVTVRPGS